MKNTPVAVIIPARYASSRFPGKPLAMLAGKPMIQHVWEKAIASAADVVAVATDDERIAAAVDGRDYCIPDDVRRVAVPVLAHRIIARTQSTVRMSDTNEKLIEFVLDSVEAPIGR